MRLLGTKTRSQRLALVGTVILGILLLCAVAAPWLAPYDPADRVTRPFARPSAEHLLGADDVGHDLLSMLIHALRSHCSSVSLPPSSRPQSHLFGIAAGYLRGAADAILMRIVDVVLSLPVLPLTIVIGVFAGPGLKTQIMVISGVLWAGLARELRAQS